MKVLLIALLCALAIGAFGKYCVFTFANKFLHDSLGSYLSSFENSYLHMDLV